MPKLSFGGLGSFCFGEGSVSLLNSFTSSMISGPKPPKSKIPEIWIFSKPQAAHLVCVEKSPAFSTQTRCRRMCKYTRLNFLKEIQAGDRGCVLTQIGRPSLCRKSPAFSTQTWWAARGFEKSRFRDFSILEVSGPKSSSL